jgi:hypothetical protein
MTRGAQRSFQLVVHPANDFTNDRLRFHIPVARVTAITDTDEQQYCQILTLVGPLFQEASRAGSDLLAIAAFSANADISKRRNILTPQFTLYRNPQRNV